MPADGAALLATSISAPSPNPDDPALSSETAAAYRPPFVVSFPITAFAVGAFVDAWEYADDEDDDIDALLEGTAAEEHGPAGGSSRRRSGVGAVGRKGEPFIERKGNCTKIAMDLQVGKEAVGDLNVRLDPFPCPHVAPSEG